ncbi:Large cysteine-rich periplasmic protein omcB precursor [Pirellulimonas nuda]|uniref:Large cysteine-rich periplasmic protein omcB n=1 Tax=Pirellulimonas nuda TaxID=2528009 RepID=A0A518DFR1_9BACT|nr:DUF11 domain-containing protein [Pirellulimonas nuda]QDU90306.1 Large cysteine-rich periplasmic protein omcB precursor [Pirellulimonas nuda]
MRKLLRALKPLAALVAVMALGCAGLPRIDPSGDRLLVFPQSSASPAPVAPAYGQGGAPAGNVVAPPVYSNASDGLGDLMFGPATPAAAAGPVAQPPGERVVMTPERLLAPVGTEVVLRAGICGDDNYLKANRRIEWMLGQQGSGEFVTVGEQGERDFARLPWSVPKKIDNQYVVGYTSPFHTCLRRGTDDPSDDLQVRRGDAWVTLTSPAEGTSYVTAFAPAVDGWPSRRATAIVYWVDAQWQFPGPVSAAAGQPATLVTTVTRQSDGAPIAGWIVRYESQDGAARLGYQAGAVAEATTDNRGRASMEVAPVNPGGGTSNIRVTIVRPEQAGVAASPRVEVASGATAVTWSGSGPMGPPVVVTPSPLPGTTPSQPVPPSPTEPAPSLPPEYVVPAPTGPPVQIPSDTGRPELEVTLKQNTPGSLRVGDSFEVEITVRNRGDGVAKNITVRDRFDAGLTSPIDQNGSRKLEYNQMPDLKPGESERVRLPFEVTGPGRHCNEVTVTADGASEAYERLCVDATEVQAELRINAVGTARAEVGQEFEYKSVVENVGQVAVENLVVELRYDPALRPTSAQAGSTQLSDGTFRWILSRLEPGEKQEFAMVGVCDQPNPQAQIILSARADRTPEKSMPWVIEVLPPGRVSPADGAGGPANSPIGVEIDFTGGRTQVGQNSIVYVYLTNGPTPQTGVSVRVEMPAGLQPNLAGIKSPTAPSPNPPWIQFAPIASMAAGEQLTITIPVQAAAAGPAAVRAQIATQAQPTPVTIEGAPLQISPR